jgi:hypothetical protein
LDPECCPPLDKLDIETLQIVRGTIQETETGRVVRGTEEHQRPKLADLYRWFQLLSDWIHNKCYTQHLTRAVKTADAGYMRPSTHMNDRRRNPSKVVRWRVARQAAARQIGYHGTVNTKGYYSADADADFECRIHTGCEAGCDTMTYFDWMVETLKPLGWGSCPWTLKDGWGDIAQILKRM